MELLKAQKVAGQGPAPPFLPTSSPPCPTLHTSMQTENPPIAVLGASQPAPHPNGIAGLTELECLPPSQGAGLWASSTLRIFNSYTSNLAPGSTR